MTTTYRVEQDGKTIYEGKTKDYDKDGIPAEYRGRPSSGEVRLFVNDELIGVQTAISADEAAAIGAQRKQDLPNEVLPQEDDQ